MAHRYPFERVFYNFMNNFFAAGVTLLFGLFIREWGISINQASVSPSYAIPAVILLKRLAH